MTRCPIDIRVQAEPFDQRAVVEAVKTSGANIGGVVTFLGVCRDEEGRLAALELEHYPGMAEEELERVAHKAADRWPLFGIKVIHRYGKIIPGEDIVIVATSSAHRRAAFEAAEYLMDFLKTRAPFWKREILKDGTAGPWVEAKDEDDTALERWAQGPGPRA